MEKREGRKNVLLVALGFFLMFVFVISLSSEIVSAEVCDYVWDQDSGEYGECDASLPNDNCAGDCSPEGSACSSQEFIGTVSVPVANSGGLLFRDADICAYKEHTCRVKANSCQPECGDGELDVGEECDGGDKCSSDCKDEFPIWCCDDNDNDLWWGADAELIWSSLIPASVCSGSANTKKLCGYTVYIAKEGNTYGCDDNPYRNPSVIETCGSGRDDNCDGVIAPACVCGNGRTELGEDCDDGNTFTGDGCDTNCKREWDDDCCDDSDGDRYTGLDRLTVSVSLRYGYPNYPSDWQCSGNDDGRDLVCSRYGFFGSEDDACDNDASINPGVTEICGDGIDQDCSGSDLACSEEGPGEPVVPIVCCDDDDGDGYTGDSSITSLLGYCPASHGEVCSEMTYLGSEGNDYGCDDDRFRNRAMIETCGSGRDDNCDGVIAPACSVGPRCGDWTQDIGEECDDGNTNSNDGCSSGCIIETCDDRIQNQGETGEDCGIPACGVCGGGGGPACGDGNVDPGEICDDGNTVSGDGCSWNCLTREGGWTCDEGNPTVCIPIPIPPVSGNYWADMNGVEIFEANLGDAVQMIAKDVTSGTFSIKEEDIALDDDIRDIAGSVEGSDLVGIWIITQEDLDEADGVLEGPEFEFYFELGEEKSDILIVSDGDGEGEGEGDDDPIVISIQSGVVCGEHFDEGTSRDIVIVASDADDVIVGSVSIYDDTIPFSNGGITFSQSFDVLGNVQILVEANTNDGDDKKRVISNVMVLEKESGVYADGSYVAACITSPEDLSDIEGRFVNFDASDTRGVRVTDGIVDELTPDNNGDEFSWLWTFYPPAEGIEKDDIGYRFDVEFPIAGVNTAKLVVDVA